MLEIVNGGKFTQERNCKILSKHAFEYLNNLEKNFLLIFFLDPWHLEYTIVHENFQVYGKCKKVKVGNSILLQKMARVLDH